MSRSDVQLRGDRAEALAAKFLERQGLQVVERNYRCRHGEIDLVARDGATLVFVEVRLRSNAAFGNAADSITTAKQRRLAAAAALYLAAGRADQACRFDAVLLDRLDASRVEWLRNIMT